MAIANETEQDNNDAMADDEDEERMPVAQHLTEAERVAQGRAIRGDVPRESHSALEARSKRDPVGLLDGQAASRVPELVPIRYGRMLVSAFTFYRGAAAIMAADLAPSPRTGLKAQLCGDAHLSNFGGFASPERELLFDLNDFDETLPGPFEWDVKRLAASFEIAGRDRNFSGRERRRAVLSVVCSYRTAMRSFASMNQLDLWYARLDAEKVAAQIRAHVDKKEAKAAQRSIAKARSKDSMKAFGKLTQAVDGTREIISDPPLIVPVRELPAPSDGRDVEEDIRGHLRVYGRSLQYDRRVLLDKFRYADMAHKVVGVGSVGSRAWIVLLLGKDDSDPVFLQVKEAQASVLEPHLGRSDFRNSGRRVVEGQRLMQAASDIFLGWVRAPETQDHPQRDYYVRQLWDWKISADLEAILPDGLELYAQACGWTLARAHARSGDRVAIASYLGKSDVFDRAIADFAIAYADLNESDYAALVSAVKSGRLEATTGV
ncbi:MAG TPA: DUF2252 domain-containing protein [Gaiellaceae bacterium]